MAKHESEPERPANGGFGTRAAKDAHRVVTPGHQHGQKLMPKRNRGSATHHKDEGSRNSAPEE